MKKTFVKSMRFESSYLVWNILSPQIVTLTEDEFLAFDTWNVTTLTENTRQRLIDAKCLNYDAEQLQKQAREKVEQMIAFPKVIYVSTTLGCNSQCDFCVVPTRSESIRGILLTKKSISSAFHAFESYYEQYFSNSDEPITVVFYGGEPLENFQAIRDTMECITLLGHRFHDRLRFHLCTNGYNLTEEIFQYLKSHKISITIAWEPARSVHLLYRDHYEKVHGHITRSIAHGITTSLSIAMVPEALSFISYIIDMSEKLGVTSYGFNFVRGRYLAKRNIPVEEYAHQLVQQLASELPRLIYREYQTTKRYEMIERGEPLSVDCGCYGNQFVLFPDGSIGHCPFQITGGVVARSNPSSYELQHAKDTWKEQLVSILDDPEPKRFGFGNGCQWGAEDSNDSYDRVTEYVNELLCEEIIKFYISKRKLC